MLAAVVKLVILFSSSPFKITPAPRNPIPATISAAILDVCWGSTIADKYVKIIEPPITKLCVLIPAGLSLCSLSKPIRNPANTDKPRPIKKSILKPFNISNTTILNFNHQLLEYFSICSWESKHSFRIFVLPRYSFLLFLVIHKKLQNIHLHFHYLFMQSFYSFKYFCI